MNEDEAKRDLVRRWLVKAWHDIAAAQKLAEVLEFCGRRYPGLVVGEDPALGGSGDGSAHGLLEGACHPRAGQVG